MQDFSNEAYFMLLSTLANRTRLAIIDVLKNGPKNVSEVSGALRQDQAAVSAGLNQMEKYALVTSKGSGNERCFSLNKEIIEPLAQVLEFHKAKHCPGMK